MDEPTLASVTSLPSKVPNIADLRAKFGPEVIILEADGEVVAIKKPSRQAYSRFRQITGDDTKKWMAAETLLGDCLVYPETLAEKEAVFDRKPALIDTFAVECIKLAGGGAEAKKY